MSICLILTALRWFMVGSFPQIFAIQFFAQTIHAFSFGLFHLIAMRIIFQNFSLGQQGRGQALYSTMWGLGVASGSILAGHYWHSLSGEHILFWQAVLCYWAWVWFGTYPKMFKLKSSLLICAHKLQQFH